MDYTKVCQGWIYCITNKVNGKKYIGKTNNIARRTEEHFNLNRKDSTRLRRAMLKYGKENFGVEILVHFTAINKKVLNKLLNWLEKHYITKYNTKDNGYNLTLGGDGLCGYTMSEEHKRKLGLNSSIKLKGRKLSSETIQKRTKTFQENKVNCRPILQYDLNGCFIKEFYSIKNAVEETGIKIGCIANCLSGKRAMGGKFIWKYKEADSFPIKINPYVNPLSPKVYYYTKDNILLGSWDSIQIAANETGIARSKIKNHCYRPSEVHRGNYFSLTAPTS